MVKNIGYMTGNRKEVSYSLPIATIANYALVRGLFTEVDPVYLGYGSFDAMVQLQRALGYGSVVELA